MLMLRFPRVLVTLALLALAIPATASTRLVTSIKPVELLVRAIAPEDMAITTLVPPGASPHNYQLRPSQRAELASADLIFWIGPEMETFLTRMLASPEFSGRSHALMSEKVPAAKNGSGESDHQESIEDRHSEGAGDHDHHHEGGTDPHVWLDPELALDMARQIHHQLSALPGRNQTVLDANLDRFTTELAQTEKDIRQRLEAARTISLFTYHDAFSRFAEHYGLTVSGVLTLSPERSPGARHVAEVQQLLRTANKPCLLTEPQFERQWWHAMTQDIAVTFSTWDPLASGVNADASGYLAFQNGLADAVLRCLPEHSQN